MQTRTRFAPSPTGFLHIGGLRTALYAYLWSKKQNGSFLLRIEDTDQGRYVEGSIENLIGVLNECGINYDEGPVIDGEKIGSKGDFGPYVQSQRLDIYKKYALELVERGKAYYCFCTKERLEELRNSQIHKGLTPKYDSKCSELSKEEVQKRLESGEAHVIRMRLPKDEEVVFDDIVRGRVAISSNDVDEQVLIKADGFPTYHFAVVVDDHLMKITHVIRGEEWLVSTPKHILLYQYFGWEIPEFVHLSTVLNKDKKKLSKRDGSAAVRDFLDIGYPPEALINYIALLGWAPPDEKEIFTMSELTHAFNLSKIHKSGAVFDIDKLDWISSQHIKVMEIDAIAAGIKPYIEKSSFKEKIDDKRLNYLSLCVKDRISYFSQVVDELEAIFHKTVDTKSEEAITAKSFETNEALYQSLIELFSQTDELTFDYVDSVFKTIQKEKGIKGKNLYMGARIALTGQIHGADIKYIICILGKDETVRRLKEELGNDKTE